MSGPVLLVIIVERMLRVMVNLRRPGGAGWLSWHGLAMSATKQGLTQTGGVPLVPQARPVRSDLEPLVPVA